MKVVKRVNSKSSITRKTIFFFNFISIGDDGCLLNLL